MTNEISRFEPAEDDEDRPPPDRLKTGAFEVDYTVQLDSGGYIRVMAAADLLVTEPSERDFVLSLMRFVQEFEASRGIQIDGA